MDISKLVLLAGISEALWETSKLFWVKDKVNVDRVGAVIVGVLLSIATGLDLFKIVGIPIYIPFLGSILTGLLLSRGANFIHDIIGSMGIVYNDKKTINRANNSSK